MVGVVALDERNSLRENGDIGSQNTAHIVINRQTRATLADKIWIDNRLIVNAFGNAQCAIMMHIAMLLLVMFNLGKGHYLGLILGFYFKLSLIIFSVANSGLPIQQARPLRSIITPKGTYLIPNEENTRPVGSIAT